MKLTLQLKLLPSKEQAEALLKTMKAFNAAATFAAKAGWDAGVYSAPSVQKLCYRELRDRFGLSSQMAVRAIGKAAEVFKRDKGKCPKFRPTGAMTYDERILSFKDCDKVSILSLQGRLLISFAYGQYQAARLDRLKGQVDLVYRDGTFYLYATIDLPECPSLEVHEIDFIGVDMGIVNLATTSDGDTFTGEQVETVRKRFQKTRRNLQRRRTKSARRILKRIRRRESRFRRHENHRISKGIVAAAKDTGRGIGLEDLKHIRERTTVRRKQRSRHSGWAFQQLRAFIEYKAKLAGVPVVALDPRNSSRECSACGHTDKANRKSQAEFRCLHCGHSSNADLNAARVLSARARALSNRASLAAGTST